MKKYVRFIVCVLIMALLVPYVTVAYADSFVTTDENTRKVTFDIYGYAAANFKSDTAATENTYPGLEGLTFYDVDGGGSSSHNWWTVKNSKYGFELYSGGYIAYTPPKAGTLSVTGYNAYNKGDRPIYITDDISNATQHEVVANSSTEATGGISVVGGRTYYITAKTTRITAVSFTPDNSAKEYCVNAVDGNEVISVIADGALKEGVTESISVYLPRYVKDTDGDWYKMSFSPDPFKPKEKSYEVTATLSTPIINVEYERSDDTVYFAEAETLFQNSSKTWNGYSGGGFVQGAGQAQTDVIPAGNYAVTIGYKGGRSEGFAQPSLKLGDDVLVYGDLGVKVTGESTAMVTLSKDSTLTLNTGDKNNEIDYIHIRKTDYTIEKYKTKKENIKLTFKDGEVIGCIGDSITHGDAGFESYHEVLYNYFMTNYPNTKLYIKNLGVSSVTAAKLLSGYEDYKAIDTYLAENPTMSKAFVMLGMNDINRSLYALDKYDSTADKREAALEEYKTNLTVIIDKLQKNGIEVILMTPSIYDATRAGSDGNLSNEGLKKCAEIVKSLAKEKDCTCIDLNSHMLEINENVQKVNPNLTLLEAWYDNVHPGAFGNNVMGYLMLRQLGEGNEDIVLSSETDETDNSTVSNTQVFNNYVSYNYTLPKLPMAHTNGYKNADCYTGFTEDMNQMIVKENLSDGIYELTIDDTVLGSYTAEELKNGVNIAFNPHNPAQIASKSAQTLNIERSKYEVMLQNSVCFEIFHNNNMVKESTYNDIMAHKEEYLQTVKEKTDKMYSVINTELAKSHKLELRLKNDEGLILPNIFTENMVLQEGKSSVYGKGVTGAKYTVTLDDGNGGKYIAEDTAENGRFKATITDAPASMTPYTLTVESSENEKKIINNVYVGEVYLLSGQSNMEMRTDHDYKTDLTQYKQDQDAITSKYGNKIKFMVLGTNPDSEPQFDAQLASADTLYYTNKDPKLDTWNNMNENTQDYISLIGMYFAEDILDDSTANNVKGPVGLLCTAVGGTDIDTWRKNGSNYNGHIAPFEDYGINGILWYQGENDSEDNRLAGRLPKAYKNAFPQLIDEWREEFGADMPFIYVQLARYSKNHCLFNTIRDAQRRALDSVSNKDNVAMIVSADTTTTALDCIHPDGKDIVAERLYKAAKNIVYGNKNTVYEGPLPERFEFKDGKAVIHFKESSISGGLEFKAISNTEGMQYAPFRLAGEDRVFVDAHAEIVGNTVEVSANGITKPVAVSYCDENAIYPTLYNKAGLPATPFNSMDTIQITAIGDSITYGYGLQNRTEQSYPVMLGKYLNNTEGFYKNNYSIDNYGKNGWTLSQSSNSPYMTSNDGTEWNNAKGTRADIYTVALGTNDSKNGIEDDGKHNIQYVKNGEFKNTYLNMIDELMLSNNKAEIYLCQPVPSLDILQDENAEGEINESRLLLVRSAIDEVYTAAHEKYGDQIKKVDMFNTFKTLIEGDTLAEANTDMYKNPSYKSGSKTAFNEYGTLNGLYLYNKNAGNQSTIELNIDSIHPGANGSELIAKTLYKEITGKEAPALPDEPVTPSPSPSASPTVTPTATPAVTSTPSADGEPIIFDIAAYVKALGISKDTAAPEGIITGLEGLTFHNGEAQTNWWVAKDPRIDIYEGGYIAYTAPLNGMLSVTGASNKAENNRYISITDDPSTAADNIVITGMQTSDIRRSVKVEKGKTYYIMGHASRIKLIEFTPDTNSIDAVQTGNDTVETTVLNIGNEDAYIYTASYAENETLLSIAKNIAKPGESSVLAKIAANAERIKVFMWDKNMKPLCGAYEIKVREINENYIEPQMSELSMWYDEPAAEDSGACWDTYSSGTSDRSGESHCTWKMKALPIGNGYQGAMIFGGVAQERIALNEKTLWNGSPNHIEDDRSDIFRESREKMLSDDAEGAKETAQKLAGSNKNYGTYTSFGNLN